jgi:hypothetical protein
MFEVFKIELMKVKRSKLLCIVTLMPLFIVFQGIGNFLRYHDLFTSKGQNIWMQVYTQSVIFYGMNLLPLIVTIVMAYLANMENKQDNWKTMLILPIEKSHMYISKFFVGAIFIFLNIIVFISAVLIGGKMLASINMAFPKEIIIRPLLAFLVLFPVMAIQYYLSIRFSNAVALGVGIAMTLPAMLIANTKYWILFPWTYAGMFTLSGKVNMFSTSNNLYLICAAIFIMVMLLGIREFNKRDVV